MGTLINEKMMRDGQLFLSWLASYSGAKTRNFLKKCIGAAQDGLMTF